MFLSAGKISHASGVSIVPTTWNPSDKAASVSLTSGNLKALMGQKGQRGLVRTIVSKTTGKFYAEFVPTEDDHHGFGLANSTQGLTSQLGGSNNGVGYSMSSGIVSKNGSTLGTIFSATRNDNIGMAFDLGASLIWYRKNGGNWNNNASYDPATATGGISFTSLGTTYVCVEVDYGNFLGDSEGSVLANFGATAFSYAVPSGFAAGFGT